VHIKTNHEEAVAVMFCDHCITTTTVATFSRFFTETVSRFAALHATCAQSGAPDYTDIDQEIAARRAAKTALGDLTLVTGGRMIDLVRA
jgi:hypothetical protein